MSDTIDSLAVSRKMLASLLVDAWTSGYLERGKDLGAISVMSACARDVRKQINVANCVQQITEHQAWPNL
jgi:hypothetical protein